MVSDLVHRAWLDLQVQADRLEQTDDPVLYLARATIACAFEEYRKARYLRVASDEMPPPSAVRGEIGAWINSPEFVWWCDLADIDADYARGRLEVICVAG